MAWRPISERCYYIYTIDITVAYNLAGGCGGVGQREASGPPGAASGPSPSIRATSSADSTSFAAPRESSRCLSRLAEAICTMRGCLASIHARHTASLLTPCAAETAVIAGNCCGRRSLSEIFGNKMQRGSLQNSPALHPQASRLHDLCYPPKRNMEGM